MKKSEKTCCNLTCGKSVGVDSIVGTVAHIEARSPRGPRFVCLCICLFVYLFICVFVCLFICLFVYLFICLFV